MKFYVLFVFLSFGMLIMYSNCGQVGETGASSAESVIEGDATRGALVYNVDGAQLACVTCHGSAGTTVVGVDLKTFSANDIETAVRTGPGTMPQFSYTDLTDQQLADVIAYIQTL